MVYWWLAACVLSFMCGMSLCMHAAACACMQRELLYKRAFGPDAATLAARLTAIPRATASKACPGWRHVQRRLPDW